MWNDDDGVRAAGDDAPDVRLAADVLVGADGIHSGVRAKVFGPEEQYLRPLDMRAAAFIVTDPQLNALSGAGSSSPTASTSWALQPPLGRDCALLVYRDAGAGQSPSVASPQERLRREFTGLGSAVDRLLELCPEHPYDDVVAQVVMADWCAGRTVLVGDASGAVSLLAGQGGSFAIAGVACWGTSLGR